MPMFMCGGMSVVYVRRVLSKKRIKFSFADQIEVVIWTYPTNGGFILLSSTSRS